MKDKGKEQERHLRLWREGGRRGLCLATTGLGKTRIGVLAMLEIAEEKKDASILVIVPRKELRDNEWPNEIKKWGAEHLNIDVQCIHTACRWSNKKYDLVVVDEVHTTVSPKFKEFYKNNSWDSIIGLTATLPTHEEDLEYLEGIMPVVSKITKTQAKRKGFISDYTTVCMPVYLLPKEGEAYSKAEDLMGYSAEHLGGKYEAFKKSFKVMKDPEADADLKKFAFMYQAAVRKRKKICWEAFNKKKTAVQLVLEFFKGEKVITFSGRKEEATQLAKLFKIKGIKAESYHSGLRKETAKKREQAFRDGDIEVLCTVKKVDMGFNVPDCKVGIVLAGTSSTIEGAQRGGRLVRVFQGKKALMINLYIPGTVDSTWLRNRLKGERNIRWINDKTEINEILQQN